MKKLILLVILIEFAINSHILKTTGQQIIDSFMDKSKKELFKVWHLVNNKKYTLDSEEAKLKYKIFKQNLLEVNQLNSDKSQPNKFGMGPFSDMTKEEMRSRYLMRPEEIQKLIEKFKQNQSPFLNDDDDDLTSRRNLRNLQSSNCTQVDFRNRIPGIKNQQSCGSCWAFSTITGVEANSFETNNVVTAYSEQYLVDCDHVDNGCNGGLLPNPIQFAINSTGIPTEESYKYTGQDGKCRSNLTNTYKVQGTLVSCGSQLDPTNKCDPNTYLSMAQKNVVMTVVYADLFFQYTGGFYNDIYWNYPFDHAVSVVGLGCNDVYQNSYYILRNSWGTNWGVNGYMYYLYQTNVSNPMSTHGWQIQHS